MIELTVKLPEESGGFTTHRIGIRRTKTNPDGVFEYDAVLIGFGTRTFEHRYSDGWMRCVERAMAALDLVPVHVPGGGDGG